MVGRVVPNAPGRYRAILLLLGQCPVQWQNLYRPSLCLCDSVRGNVTTQLLLAPLDLPLARQEAEDVAARRGQRALHRARHLHGDRRGRLHLQVARLDGEHPRLRGMDVRIAKMGGDRVHVQRGRHHE